jgi:hypothetical protein
MARCARMSYEEEAIVVGDLARDPRFASDSVVHSLKLRFYAGVPLVDKKAMCWAAFPYLMTSLETCPTMSSRCSAAWRGN